MNRSRRRWLLTNALKRAKWAIGLSIRDVLKAYELGNLLNAFADGRCSYSDERLYSVLKQLVAIVLQGRLDCDHPWFEDIVQDTVTYVMVERQLVQRGEHRVWRHLLATISRKPQERLIDSEGREHLGLFGQSLGDLQDRGGLRFTSERIDHLLSTGRLLLIPDEIREDEPELARYIDHVIHDVTVTHPRWLVMIAGYKSLSHSMRAIQREEVQSHARTTRCSTA